MWYRFLWLWVSHTCTHKSHSHRDFRWVHVGLIIAAISGLVCAPKWSLPLQYLIPRGGGQQATNEKYWFDIDGGQLKGLNWSVVHSWWTCGVDNWVDFMNIYWKKRVFRGNLPISRKSALMAIIRANGHIPWNSAFGSLHEVGAQKCDMEVKISKWFYGHSNNDFTY